MVKSAIVIKALLEENLGWDSMFGWGRLFLAIQTRVEEM